MQTLTPQEALSFTVAQKILSKASSNGYQEMTVDQRQLAIKYCNEVDVINQDKEDGGELRFTFDDGSTIITL